MELFADTAENMKKAKADEEAAKVQAWSNDWLSILGVNKGLTGLVKDFVLNYLGRSAYHDKNGPLIDAVKEAGAQFPQKGEEFTKEHADRLRDSVVTMCKAGIEIFEKGGSMYQMIHELGDLMEPSNIPHFAAGVKKNGKVQEAFAYLAAPSPHSDEL